MKLTGPPVRVVMPIAVWTRQAASGRTSDDRVAVHRIPGGVVIVVADGAGGQAGGSLAADAVLASIADRLSECARVDVTDIDWVELLRAIDHRLAGDPRAGESTCVVAHLHDDGTVRGAAAGDTEAVLIGDEATVEDLTAPQADTRKKRLGSGRARPTTFERRTDGRPLLLATDGLFGYAPLATLAGIVHAHRPDLDEATSLLVDAARMPSGGLHDDIALAIAHTARPRVG